MSKVARSFLSPHVILLSVALMVIIAATAVPTVRGAEVEEGQTEKVEPKREPGFWESNSVVTEIVGFPIFLILLAGAMASNSTTTRITTEHWEWYGKPLAKSYTDITVPKQPSSDEEIKTTLIVLTVVYLALRFTCGFSFFNVIWQMIGGLVDIFFSIFFGIFQSMPK